MPNFCNQMPIGRPLFRVSHMRVPTLWGLKKCHNLAKIYCSIAKESSSSTMSLKALETVYYLADKVMYPFFEL